jgi:hypothetical protein
LTKKDDPRDPDGVAGDVAGSAVSRRVVGEQSVDPLHPSRV